MEIKKLEIIARKKFDKHPHAQAEIRLVSDDGHNHSIELCSYNTIIITIPMTYYEGAIYCSGLYSMTTRRHISWFLAEIFNDFYAYYNFKSEYLYHECEKVGGWIKVCNVKHNTKLFFAIEEYMNRLLKIAGHKNGGAN